MQTGADSRTNGEREIKTYTTKIRYTNVQCQKFKIQRQTQRWANRRSVTQATWERDKKTHSKPQSQTHKQKELDTKKHKD